MVTKTKQKTKKIPLMLQVNPRKYGVEMKWSLNVLANIVLLVCFTCLFVCLFVCLPQTGIIFSIEGFEYYKITNKTGEAKFALLQFLFCRFLLKEIILLY